MLNYSANGPSGYNLTNSLRFRSSASATLTRTPTSSTNRRTWTWSNWIKRGKIDVLRLCGSGTSPTNETSIYFDSNNKLAFVSYIGSENARLITTQVFRDPAAWYHIVVAVDTTQATAANRIKLYVNGNQVTAFDTATYPSQNYETLVNSTTAHYYGTFDTSYYYDGYVTDAILIDGQALTPSSFGSTNSITGVWQPAKYTGTYGTNGFYLNFTDIALTSGSNTGLGRDFSGNGNFWNTNNISVTSGVTYDAMTDVPTNTSATVANYAVMNPLKMPAPASVSYANGNLTVSAGTANQTPALATIYPSSGKWYWEVTWTSGSFARLGVQNTNVASTDFAADTAGWRWESNTGNIYNGSNGNLSTVSTYVAGDILGFCLDSDTGRLYVSKNGTWQNSAVPASGTGAVATNIPTNTLMSPAVATGSGSVTFNVNFGQRPFSYTPPTGFVALNTFNLPTSAVVKGNSVMDATIYSGNNTTNTIINSGAFRPDVIWVKNRSGGYGHNHVLVDSIRGGSNKLFPNLTNAQSTSSVAYSSLNSNGFTLENSGGANNDMNESGFSYVAWQWQAGQGSTSSNTSGSITSTVSVNANAGVSIVAYTNSAGRATHTVGHGLGVAPRMFIIKTRSATADWVVYHASLGATQALYLNQTLSAQTSSTFFNNTAPTSTVITLGSGLSDAGVTIVAYCFAEIAGFSRFGSYVANASSDGPFIYTGFRPRWIMFKRTTSATNWYVIDTSISPINASTSGLYPNTTAEVSTEGAVDILSNGFKCRVSSGAFNFPGNETFAYVAFAENPFKNALAR